MRIFLFMFFLCVSGAAQAGQSATVTSIEKCYAGLGEKDVLDIQRNYVKPYQECLRRRALLEKEKNTLKATEETSAVDSAPSSAPRNFVRVQKSRPQASAPQKEQEPEKPRPIVQEKIPLR